jgi:hypothetical protein
MQKPENIEEKIIFPEKSAFLTIPLPGWPPVRL